MIWLMEIDGNRLKYIKFKIGLRWFSCANAVSPSYLALISASLPPWCRIWSLRTRRFCISWKRTRACCHRPACRIQQQGRWQLAKMFWSSEGLSLRFNVGTIQTEGNLQETMKHSFWNTKKTHNGVFRLFSHPVSVACLLTSTNSHTVGDGVLRLLRIILGMESDLSDGHSKYLKIFQEIR